MWSAFSCGAYLLVAAGSLQDTYGSHFVAGSLGEVIGGAGSPGIAAVERLEAKENLEVGFLGLT